MICANLEGLGIELDEELNKQAVRGKARRISKEGSRVAVYVIPTNEELLLARDTVRVVKNVAENLVRRAAIHEREHLHP